jgi:hypothetical protein
MLYSNVRQTFFNCSLSKNAYQFTISVVERRLVKQVILYADGAPTTYFTMREQCIYILNILQILLVEFLCFTVLPYIGQCS